MSLTPKQQWFFALIEQSSVSEHVLPFYDKEKRSLRTRELKRLLPAMSSGERIMNKFFAGLWRNENEFDFDIFEAVQSLDPTNKDLIIDWLEDPFWP